MTIKEAKKLAKLYPLEMCKCGTVTLGGSDVVIKNGETTFPEHNCQTMSN
jgi:hypothetical protein